MIVEHPKKCPNCQSKDWYITSIIGAMSDNILSEMVDFGIAGNYACVLSPAWDKDNVNDLREDILTSISDGWEWGSLIRDFLTL
jgi:hypothetical protein